jgi:pimeloyl-ACP methyl ester carboxylesterase
MTGSLLDHPLLASRYLFPRRVALADPFFVATADGTAQLACHLTSPYADTPTVIHFHGNGEVVADYVPEMSAVFTALGVNVLFAEYRGYGASAGVPSVGALLDDAHVILTAVGKPPEQIILFGRSVGSIPAIELAAHHPRIAGLILESGIADPLERLLLRVSAEELSVSKADLEAAVLARMDHRRKLGLYGGPILVLHALRDSLVPCSHAKRNFAWAAGPEDVRRLLLFPKGDHNTIFWDNRDEYVAALDAFFGLLSRAAAQRV